jgi:endonuclease/exonuclease/phosphatase family metal-dependent hydrolase
MRRNQMPTQQFISIKQIFRLIPWLLIFLITTCEPLVTQFDDIEDAVSYSANHQTAPPTHVDTLLVMTWNIRFAIGRIPWFGDSCGDLVIVAEDQVLSILNGLAEKINEIKPDILLLQEVDVESKRTAYIDEVQWLLDHTYFNYASYASMWQAQYVPSDGLGRINNGQAILSRWKISEAERIQLPLCGDQDALTKYFYLRRNILKVKIDVPGMDNFYVLNTHLDAFSTDDTRQKQVYRFKEELDKLSNSGAYFVAGGDLNLIPPGSDSTDFCMEDKCPDESFHGVDDNPKHKEGSYFTPTINWLQDLFDTYQSSVPVTAYRQNQQHYFTHTPKPQAFWDRKLDHLFSNSLWVPGSDVTYQDIVHLSDHIPTSAKWEVPK